MVTRYAMLTGLVVVVALAAGAIVHKVAGHSTYTASCDFQLALPSTSTAPSSDILVFNRRQADDEIARAQLGKVWDAVSRETGVPAEDVASDQSVAQVSDSSFRVTVTNPDATAVVKVANALCGQYVRQLTGQVQAEQSNEVSGLRNQISGLEHQLQGLQGATRNGASAAQQIQAAAITNATKRAEYVLALALSLPPDNISVLSRASDAFPKSTKPSLSKALIIAAAAGLLASFLLILAVETTRGHRLELEER